MIADLDTLVACPSCDALHRTDGRAPQARAACARCGAVLATPRDGALAQITALGLAMVILMIAAVTFPFLQLSAQGLRRDASVIDAVLAFAAGPMLPLSLAVGALIVAIPLMRTAAILYALWPLSRGGRPLPRAADAFRLTDALRPWSMAEIFIVGVTVALVKIQSIAQVSLGPAFWAFIALVIVTMAQDWLICRQTVWARLGAKAMTGGAVLTAREAGLIGCVHCCRVSPMGTSRCGWCGAALHSRKPASLQKVWAWLIAGIIAYIPANLYPMLITSTLTERHASTIVAGAIELFEAGSYAVAAIVFFASVVIPVGKFVAIAWLAIVLQRGRAGDRHSRHRFHVMVDFIGRWSMIDIFVVAILSALVQLGQVATIAPGIAAISFAFSVVFTMLSAQAFDPRSIWDQEPAAA